jgi:hypothetical protein
MARRALEKYRFAAGELVAVAPAIPAALPLLTLPLIAALLRAGDLADAHLGERRNCCAHGL